MLVLSRQEGQSIRIGDIEVRIAKIRGRTVRVAVNAPRDVPVHREEIYAVIAANGRAAAVGGGFKDAGVPRGAEAGGA